MDINVWATTPLIAIACIGLVAGCLGGLLGVGGSVIMIPSLAFLFGGEHQHQYQAAAMLVNVAVAFPAMRRHRQAGAIMPPVLKGMLPAAIVGVLAGVWVSNLPLFRGADGGIKLGRVLAVFLVYVIYTNTVRLFRDRPANVDPTTQRQAPPSLGKCSAVGIVMGGVAGLLGIGGGAIAVPLQQLFLRLPLRNCIANSTGVICVSAGLGAIYKNASLHQHGESIGVSLLIAFLLAPTAWIGGRLGASLTHKLPVRQVRIIFIGLITVAAWKMAALPWP